MRQRSTEPIYDIRSKPEQVMCYPNARNCHSQQDSVALRHVEVTARRLHWGTSSAPKTHPQILGEPIAQLRHFPPKQYVRNYTKTFKRRKGTASYCPYELFL